MNAKSEPLLTAGTIAALIAALLVFLKAMGLPITDDQQEAIRNLVAVAAPIVLAAIARQLVFAPATTEAIADEQYKAGRQGESQPKVAAPPGK